jgi:large subunit ribosomal protein L19
MTMVALMRPLESIEKDWLRKKTPKFDVGDTVDVHVKIIEGDRERVQVFSGIVIARRHQGASESFTVRRIVQGEGVERIFPLHSPRVVDVVVVKMGKVRRAKLHFLRERTGRATRVEERLGGVVEKEEAAPPAPETRKAEGKPAAEPAPAAKPPPK